MKSKQQCQKKLFINVIHHSEKGIILIITLALLAIIAMVATVVFNTTNTDIKISTNYKTSTQAFYAAEAGIQEARARLIGSSTTAGYVGDPADPFNGTWTAYIMSAPMDPSVFDPDWSGTSTNYIPTLANNTNTGIVANSLQTAIPYFVKIRHKREFDAEKVGHTVAAPHYVDDDGSTVTHTAANPGNIIYWGYGTTTTPVIPFQFTSSTSTRFEPVEIILAAGTSSTSLQIVVTEVVHEPGPSVVAALYSKSDVQFNGANITVSGTDTCEKKPTLPSVYTKAEINPEPPANPMNADLGGPSDPEENGTIDIDIQAYVDVLKETADVILFNDNNMSPGPTTIQTYYFKDTGDPTDQKFANVVGSGILLVDGNLEFRGTLDWEGLIVVTGDLTFVGGGQGKNIKGAVLSNNTTDVSGSVEITYDSCALSDAFDNASLRIISWKQKY
ncbi:MAG: PilX N-terminal domain-containing pilus assembly protein [Candidatus Anammoxibacter sp.]